ncbi:MAG: hypothetical protein PHY94_03595 [Candidatus Omnitrophica bacterium]|nr:hypothetical protein [Candidatus Omnitrophota bacterium]
MKRSYFLKIICCFLFLFSLVAFIKAVCDDEESSLNTLCGNVGDLRYYEVLAEHLNAIGSIFYEQRHDLLGLESFILYLERQEKSPPFRAFA